MPGVPVGVDASGGSSDWRRRRWSDERDVTPHFTVSARGLENNCKRENYWKICLRFFEF